MLGDGRLVGSDHLCTAKQCVVHCLGRHIDAADQLDENVRIARERHVDVRGEVRILAVALRMADQHRADVEQLRLRLQQFEHAGADGAAAEQCDF